MVALFDGLRRAFPDRRGARAGPPRDRVVEAEDWAVGDSHTVPHFDPETGRNRFSTLQPGERFTLSEWVDHMISASANSAGVHGVEGGDAAAPRSAPTTRPSRPRSTPSSANTPKTELTELSLAVINEPLAAAGIDLAGFRQGTLFTTAGARKIPGVQLLRHARASWPASCCGSSRVAWSTAGRASR